MAHREMEEIREELLNGRGTQFDPKFAEIMLSMSLNAWVHL